MHIFKRILTTAALAGFLSFSLLAAAEEPASEQTASAEDAYQLEADIVYRLDLDGDGTMEDFSFLSRTEESDNVSRAVLELYVDGKMVWSQADEDWSYRWRVSRCPLSDGHTYLTAASISDNDWTNHVLVLAKDGDSFTILADLADLSRKSEEHPENVLSIWARTDAVTDVSENTFTLTWSETLMSAGILRIPVTYVLTDGQVLPQESSCPLDRQKEWTAWMEFDVMETPESETVLYRVSEGEKVRLTEFVSIAGRSYLKCENSQGQEGWFADPEEFISGTPDGDSSYYFGYFKESVFAG